MRWWWVLLLSGCASPWARANVALLVPALELRASYRLRSARDAEHAALGVGAFLRWRGRAAASSLPSRVEQTPAVWLAPCSLEDAVCLTEAAEAEREIASALRGVP